MKLSHAALLTGVAATLLFGTVANASAQFHLGAHGMLSDVRDVTASVGGRLGYFQPPSIGRTQFGVEAAYGYFFPDCIGLISDDKIIIIRQDETRNIS